MDGLSAVGSIIAIVQLSSKVAKLCTQYSLEVKDARDDISRLRAEVENLERVLKDVQHLFEGPDGATLTASGKMTDAVNGCSSQLMALRDKLDPGQKRKAMSRLGFRAMKWPFQSKEVEKVIGNLERCKGAISLAFQVDQAELLQDIHRKIDLSKLPCAEGAAFDSYQDELDARCHPDTRIELLRHIREWAADPHSKSIFWLNGKAGTGKSTISRTVAQFFADNGELGGSFFFKRGGGERGSAIRLFTTIAFQLVRRVPAILPHVRQAIEEHPDISGRVLKEQFQNLIYQTLSELGNKASKNLKLILVIDALDECDREDDIKIVLHLISQLRQLSGLHLRTFLTSRPELPIRLGFKKMSAEAHQDVMLQEIPQPIIKHDIACFLRAEFKKITDDYNCLRNADSYLPQDWPGEQSIEALSDMAVPLFIFAATVTRFVGDPRWDPRNRLADVLKYQFNSQVSKLDRTYLPIMDRLLADLSDLEKEDLVGHFKEVIGSIVVLAEPLGLTPLARLLQIPHEAVGSWLDPLHSVLDIPLDPESPIRLLHISLREFLTDSHKHGKSVFWVDQKERHEAITIKCLEMMSKNLKENIGHLEFPGQPRTEIDSKAAEKYLPADVRYACRYWVHHLEEAKRPVRDQDPVHTFLQKHFLHWLECLSLLGKISESIGMIVTLVSLASGNGSGDILRFLSDAKRFILRYRSIIDISPLQLYSSAIVFTPRESVIRCQFERPIQWICRLPKVPLTWSRDVQVLEGRKSIFQLAFSPNGQLLASVSYYTVSLWDVPTGERLHGLLHMPIDEGPERVSAVVFSNDGQLLASISFTKKLRLWDVTTGEITQEQVLKFSEDSPMPALSSDGQLLASVSEAMIARVWNIATGEKVLEESLQRGLEQVMDQALEQELEQVQELGLEHELGQVLEDHGNLMSWNQKQELVQKLMQKREVECHSDWVLAVAFSPDGQPLALASKYGIVSFWNLVTGEQVQGLEGSTWRVNSMSVHIKSLMTSISHSGTKRLLNVATRKQLMLLERLVRKYRVSTNAVAIHPDGQLLALAGTDGTIILRNTMEETELLELEQRPKDNMIYPCVAAFSPDGQLLASISNDTVTIWDVETGAQAQVLKCLNIHNGRLAFSPNGQLIALVPPETPLELWNVVTGEQVQVLGSRDEWILAVAFSPDGQAIALGCEDGTVELWDLVKGEQVQVLEGHNGVVQAVVFSPDGETLASASADETVRLWKLGKGEEVQMLGHEWGVQKVAYSPDGQLLAAASYETVWLWHATTGKALQQIKQDCYAHQFGFSSNGQCLDTDRGTIRLSSSLITAQSSVPNCSGDIRLKRDWITCNGRNLLWLPPEYRGDFFNFKGNLVALPHSSGRVHFIEFSPQSIMM